MTQETIDLVDEVAVSTGMTKSLVVTKALWEMYGDKYGTGADTWKRLVKEKNKRMEGDNNWGGNYDK